MSKLDYPKECDDCCVWKEQYIFHRILEILSNAKSISIAVKQIKKEFKKELNND